MGVKTKLSAAALAATLAFATPLIERVEGVEFTPYVDIAGVPTVCAGITGPDVIKGKKYTKSECNKLLVKHVTIAAEYVDSKVKVDIPPSMRAALISFTFNVGRGNFGSSTLLKDLNKGNLKGACTRLYDWVYFTDPVTKKKVKSSGLLNRRAEEYAYCVKELK
ncbi:lysin [Erwinia phage Snitter]|nr:lysin [Erwinia phage Snitter]